MGARLVELRAERVRHRAAVLDRVRGFIRVVAEDNRWDPRVFDPSQTFGRGQVAVLRGDELGERYAPVPDRAVRVKRRRGVIHGTVRALQHPHRLVPVLFPFRSHARHQRQYQAFDPRRRVRVHSCVSCQEPEVALRLFQRAPQRGGGGHRFTHRDDRLVPGGGGDEGEVSALRLEPEPIAECVREWILGP